MIVPLRPGAKSIVSPLAEAWIVARSDPAPLSLVFVTVAACATAGTASNTVTPTSTRRPRRITTARSLITMCPL